MTHNPTWPSPGMRRNWFFTGIQNPRILLLSGVPSTSELLQYRRACLWLYLVFLKVASGQHHGRSLNRVAFCGVGVTRGLDRTAPRVTVD